MKTIISLTALALAAVSTPAMAQTFEKQEQRASAAVEQMKAQAANLQRAANGASLAEMQARFNKPAAEHCHEHDGSCEHCADKDCADCPEHQAEKGDCTDCPDEGGGLCKEKGHG